MKELSCFDQDHVGLVSLKEGHTLKRVLLSICYIAWEQEVWNINLYLRVNPGNKTLLPALVVLAWQNQNQREFDLKEMERVWHSPLIYFVAITQYY